MLAKASNPMPPPPAAAAAPQSTFPTCGKSITLNTLMVLCMKSIDNGVDPSIQNKDGGNL
jgi:hypothetical protein